MTIQTLKDITLPNGMTVKAGGVLNVPEGIGAALIEQGAARLRTPQRPTEKKVDNPLLVPGDPLPPQIPFVRVPAPPQPPASFVPGGFEDQDNFVRDLVTIASPFQVWASAFGWFDWTGIDPPPPVTPSPSASDRPAVVTLDQIKIHCHIELEQTDEDLLLLDYEMAARLHAENYLRYQIDSGVGENIKQALLMLIAHWYRNRETVTTGRSSAGTMMPMAFFSLLSLERDYPTYS